MCVVFDIFLSFISLILFLFPVGMEMSWISQRSSRWMFKWEEKKGGAWVKISLKFKLREKWDYIKLYSLWIWIRDSSAEYQKKHGQINKISYEFFENARALVFGPRANL